MNFFDILLAKKEAGSGAASAVLIDKTITANGTYNATADSADGYKKVVASVPNTYTSADEGKVVDGGALVSQTSLSVTENDTYDTTLIDEVTVNVSGGGGGISDGIVVTERNATGYATKATLYADDGVIYIDQFCNGNGNNAQNPKAFYLLEELTVVGEITTIQARAFIWTSAMTMLDMDFSHVTSIAEDAFKGCSAPMDITLSSYTGNTLPFWGSGLVKISAPLATGIGNGSFRSCTHLTHASFPYATSIGSYTANTFNGCTALQVAEFGSVGHACTGTTSDTFSGCTQAGLTITIYTKGANVATVLSNIRNGATNATIIIKASENTTYNNVSYNAGDTIVTSTP